MEEIRRRPFKVCDSDRTRTIGMVVQSLEELKDRAGNKFGLTPTTCRVFLEKDGTEIDDEEYFRFLDDQTKLMVVNDGKEWMAGSQSKLLKIKLIYLVANHCFIRSNFVSTDLHSLKIFSVIRNHNFLDMLLLFSSPRTDNPSPFYHNSIQNIFKSSS